MFFSPGYHLCSNLNSLSHAKLLLQDAIALELSSPEDTNECINVTAAFESIYGLIWPMWHGWFHVSLHVCATWSCIEIVLSNIATIVLAGVVGGILILPILVLILGPFWACIFKQWVTLLSCCHYGEGNWLPSMLWWPWYNGTPITTYSYYL